MFSLTEVITCANYLLLNASEWLARVSPKRLSHRGPTQSVCVADCYFIVNVLDLPFASPIAIYR